MPLGFAWIDSRTALLAIWNDDRSTILRTVDGGDTWSQVDDPSVQGSGKFVKSIAFQSDGHGILVYEDRSKPGTPKTYLATTRDRGTTWVITNFKRPVSFCEPVGHAFWCSSAMNVLKVQSP
jgi:hypothetical protein